MSQVNSKYERKPFDLYSTPSWVTNVIAPYIKRAFIWEPAAGEGAMALALIEAGFHLITGDIQEGDDFLAYNRPIGFPCHAIVTNPPYKLADEFCRHALNLMAPLGGQVAMLLRVDFDSGKTRRDLFENNPAWGTKIVLLDRIRWFEAEGAGKSPSENHAWFLWDFQHTGRPVVHYAAKIQEDF